MLRSKWREKAQGDRHGEIRSGAAAAAGLEEISHGWILEIAHPNLPPFKVLLSPPPFLSCLSMHAAVILDQIVKC